MFVLSQRLIFGLLWKIDGVLRKFENGRNKTGKTTAPEKKQVPRGQKEIDHSGERLDIFGILSEHRQLHFL